MGLLFSIIKSKSRYADLGLKLANLIVFIALYEIGVLDRRADLAFDICS